MAGAIPSLQQLNPSVQAAQSLLGNSSTAPAQQTDSAGFASTMADANRQLLTMENFLKFRLIGQKLNGYNNGVQAMSGMVTQVIESKEGFSVKIYDSRNRQNPILELPVFFKESKGGPAELVDRAKLKQHLESVERLKRENYINSSEIVEMPSSSVPPTIQSPQPYQRIPGTIQYIDKSGKPKQGNLILKDNKLYLDNGSEVMIRFGDND